ncbi:sterol desaturase family protein [Rhodophyticola sp. MJ-SS7]|nr:sterol desaturase family protein [Rhodophyticola sp. MJ-SS7]
MHRSNLLDVKLFAVHRVLTIFGVTGATLFVSYVAHQTTLLITGLTGNSPPPRGDSVVFGEMMAVTLIAVMATDFCKYWAHRMHHEWPVLWPFHAVHHSAEVLTPLTLMRAHPFETFFRNVFISLLVGLIQGAMVFALVGQSSLLVIGGANAFYVVFNALGANLRHSQVWLSFGPAIEHIFISPAQHQVHHSMDKRHHNKNYGSMFAIWDWMFGTLYVPRNGQEQLRFGVADEEGRPLGQPHETLTAALFNPFTESWAVMQRKAGRRSIQSQHEAEADTRS